MLQADDGPVTAPRPLRGRLGQSRTDRVEWDVAEHLPEVCFANDVDQERAILDEVTGARSPRSVVTPPRETPVELAHSLGQATFPKLDQEVVVIGHQAPVEHDSSPALRPTGEELDELLDVFVVMEHRLIVIAE